MERRQLFGLMGLLLYALSSSAGAELKPLDDDALDRVTGQAGLSINVQTRIQASEIRYSQHNNDGSERGSISLKNFDLFGAGEFGRNRPGDRLAPIALLDVVVDEPENRGFVELGLSNRGVISAASLLSIVDPINSDFSVIDSRGNVLPIETITLDSIDSQGLVLQDPITGGALPSVTASIDVGDNALSVVLPRLTRIQQAFFEVLGSSDASTFVLDTVASTIAAIPFGLEFDLAINDQTLGRVLIKNFVDVDTELRFSGRSDGTSGVLIHLDLGVGFESISFFDTDTEGGEFSLEGVRLGQVTERFAGNSSSRPGIGFRFAVGAPVLGLSLDAEVRDLVDLTTGLSREATVLRLGLPDIQNLDLTVDNIRIGEGNLGGFEILDINTLVDNNRVLELNQRFGYNIAPGTGTGVDALGQAANGYQLSGELLLSGTADNSLQFNGQWGGQIGSIRYYDSLRGEEGQLALNDISVFNTAQDEQGNTLLTPAEFQGTLTLTPQGVEFGNLNAQGSIAIQSVTVGQTNLGAFLIDNFQLRNSHITISGK